MSIWLSDPNRPGQASLVCIPACSIQSLSSSRVSDGVILGQLFYLRSGVKPG
ncbi:MAG: hypothetical protein ABJG80_10855 [Paracoccaceae bacterium]